MTDQTSPAKRVVGRPFQPGQSGNPGGRPAQGVNIRALARQYTEKAIRALVDALDDPRTKVAAATELLNRGWGKAPQPMSGEDGEGDAKLVVQIVTGVPMPDVD